MHKCDHWELWEVRDSPQLQGHSCHSNVSCSFTGFLAHWRTDVVESLVMLWKHSNFEHWSVKGNDTPVCDQMQMQLIQKFRVSPFFFQPNLRPISSGNSIINSITSPSASLEITQIKGRMALTLAADKLFCVLFSRMLWRWHNWKMTRRLKPNASARWVIFTDVHRTSK